ncbi:hypothetical protein [Amycolatopsis sp. NPDC059021]|uniref:hypothetical protein n=1 Tax=Amycolatopsis sp. NPDC059021 TaxID=3346704 RepID=UPI00366ED7A7
MLVRTTPGVTPTVLPDGNLELACAVTGERVRCGPAGAAMWIALQQHAGRLDHAARTLAGVWGRDPGRTRAEMAAWARRLCDAGLLECDAEAGRYEREDGVA